MSSERKTKTMGLLQKAKSNYQKVGNFFKSLPTKVGGIYKSAVLQPQIDMQKELAKYQYDKNLEMWNMQNEYNSPANQRARMEAAGFNPNYMAGGGASSTGNASPASMPQYNMQAPSYDPVNFYSSIIGAANGLMQLRATRANVEKIEAQTGKLGIEEQFLRDTKTQRKAAIIAGTSKRWTDQALGEQLIQYRGGGIASHPMIYPSGMFSKQRTAIDQQIENQRADLVFKQYRNDLAKYGIYSSDNFMYRMGIKALDTIGIDPHSWLKKGSTGLSSYLNSKR